VNLQTNPIPERLFKILAQAKCISFVSHEHPDGDAVSSATALYNYFSKKFDNCYLVMPTDFPEYLKKIPGCSHIVKFTESKDEAKRILSESDVIFCSDFNDEKRTGNMADFLKKSNAVKIMLDHHPSPSGFAEFYYSDIEACSASEVVYEFLLKYDETFLNPEIAECLFTGILTDTVCFSVNSSRPRTFEITAKLLEQGIDKDRIYSDIFTQFTESRTRLSGYLMNEKMVILNDIRAAYIVLTAEEQKKYQFRTGDSEGFVNIPLSIAEMNVSIFMQEKSDHFKLSLRSRNGVDVNIMARKYFNGGGHKNAAGGKIYVKTLDEALRVLIHSMHEFLE
jgi:phosphoesterase RecJ-like protein